MLRIVFHNQSHESIVFGIKLHFLVKQTGRSFNLKVFDIPVFGMEVIPNLNQ